MSISNREFKLKTPPKDAPSFRDDVISISAKYARGPQLWETLLMCYLNFFDKKMTEEQCIFVEDEYAEELLSLMTCIDRGFAHAYGKEHKYKRAIDLIRSSIYNTVESKKRFQ